MRVAPTGGVVLGLEPAEASCAWSLVRLAPDQLTVIQCGVIRARRPSGNRAPAPNRDARIFAEFAGLLRVVIDREYIEAVVRTATPTDDLSATAGRVLGVTDAAAAEVRHLVDIDRVVAGRAASAGLTGEQRAEVVRLLEEDETPLLWLDAVLRTIGAVIEAQRVDETVGSVVRLRRPGPQRT